MRILFNKNKAKPAIQDSAKIPTFRSNYEKTSLHQEYGSRRNKCSYDPTADELFFEHKSFKNVIFGTYLYCNLELPECQQKSR